MRLYPPPGGAYRERRLNPGEDWQPTHAGIYLPPDPSAAPAPDVLTGIDLFSGAGGFSLGFHQSGWHVRAAVELDPHAAATYLLNLGGANTEIHFLDSTDEQRWEKAIAKQATRSKRTGAPAYQPGGGWISHEEQQQPVEHFYLGDIRNLDPATVLDDLAIKPGDAGCVFGGPPCQGYSSAGRRQVMDPRNSLVFEFMRFVVATRPKTFVMENVPGMLSMVTAQGVPVIDMLGRIAEDGDYMTVDAFKRTMAAQSDAVGFLRSTGAKHKRSPCPAEPDESTEQLQLLA